jgi:arylformamidase
MELFDISLTISQELPIWPGDPNIELTKISQIAKGDLANVTHLSAAVHIGTHIDAPDHFLNNEEYVEDIPLDLLVGPALVVEVITNQHISLEDLSCLDLPPGAKRILFKPSNSQYWAKGEVEFQQDYIALSPGAAHSLVERGVELVGVDYLSVAPFEDPAPTHQILLGNNVLIIEGLNLSGVTPGEYTLFCLPLKIKNADGAPARVLISR